MTEKELYAKPCPRCGKKNPPLRVVTSHSGIGEMKIVSCMACKHVIHIFTAGEEKELCASSKQKNS